MSHSSKTPNEIPLSGANQGYFGRMFKGLPSLSVEEEKLEKLALAMYKQDREDSNMPAGYTYFGQFVSHDITFDPTSKLDRVNDPMMLSNFRTPRFDLDSIYGSGPDDHPYLYNDIEEKDFNFTINLDDLPGENNTPHNIEDCVNRLLEIAKDKIKKNAVVSAKKEEEGMKKWVKEEFKQKIDKIIDIENEEGETNDQQKAKIITEFEEAIDQILEVAIISEKKEERAHRIKRELQTKIDGIIEQEIAKIKEEINSANSAQQKQTLPIEQIEKTYKEEFRKAIDEIVETNLNAHIQEWEAWKEKIEEDFRIAIDDIIKISVISTEGMLAPQTKGQFKEIGGELIGGNIDLKKENKKAKQSPIKKKLQKAIKDIIDEKVIPIVQKGEAADKKLISQFQKTINDTLETIVFPIGQGSQSLQEIRNDFVSAIDKTVKANISIPKIDEKRLECELHKTITGEFASGCPQLDEDQSNVPGRDKDKGMLLTKDTDLKDFDKEAFKMPRGFGTYDWYSKEKSDELFKNLNALGKKAIYKVCQEYLTHLDLTSAERQLSLSEPDLTSGPICETLAYISAYVALQALHNSLLGSNGMVAKSAAFQNTDDRWSLYLMNKLFDIIVREIKIFAVTVAKGSMLIGEVPPKGRRIKKKEPDLPRNARGKAIMGDPRNDVNTLISQLHLCFLKFHNHVIRTLALKRLGGEEFGENRDLFAEARRIVTWHYQWVVLHDFLRRLVGNQLLDGIITEASEQKVTQKIIGQNIATIAHTKNVKKLKLTHFDWEDNIYMPVEFAAAAYRFGHTLIRSKYTLNNHFKVNLNGEEEPLPFPIYLKSDVSDLLDDDDPRKGGLKGGRVLPAKWTLQWDHFLDFRENPKSSKKPKYLQFAKKISRFLAPELGNIPISLRHEISLAEANLLKGYNLKLPSGQKVAQKMGLPTLDISKLQLDRLVELNKWNKANQLIKKSNLKETFGLVNDLNGLNEANKLEIERLIDQISDFETFQEQLLEDLYKKLTPITEWIANSSKSGSINDSLTSLARQASANESVNETIKVKMGYIYQLAQLQEFWAALNHLTDSINFDWLGKQMPLWYFILAEAELHSQEAASNEGLLGPVGGTIVAEVFLGLLSQDPNSYWNWKEGSSWSPGTETLKIPKIGKHFELRDIIAYSGMPTNRIEWKNVVP